MEKSEGSLFRCWFPLSQVKSKSPDRWEEFASIWSKWVEEADPRGNAEIYRDEYWLVMFWLLSDTSVPFHCYEEAASMLSLKVVTICKSKNWMHDTWIGQSNLNALFWELLSWLLSVSVTLSGSPRPPCTPKVAYGQWLPFPKRRTSRNEGHRAEICKSWKASTEPRLSPSSLALEDGKGRWAKPPGNGFTQHVL